jgi:hypothetical protein
MHSASTQTLRIVYAKLKWPEKLEIFLISIVAEAFYIDFFFVNSFVSCHSVDRRKNG